MAILPYRESKIHLISLVLVQLRVHVNHFFRNRKDGSIAVFLPPGAADDSCTNG